ncbi:uncharacterized protein KD926_010894 [Aspergillus affinis]|uniref:uncharacterized protein n=1 Tax=Aspergillus affinis TaxID=1070780 RepID=UPI0022FEC0D2|nr:uncharacterized protein KD926_010894 [Aspergillus affinis]KAI9038358.1 hypothetical protein KD926_010894 [Aspergillus affinis]
MVSNAKSAGTAEGEVNQQDAKFILECVDIAKVGEALGYTNPASVANRFRLLRKRYGFHNLECTNISSKGEDRPSAASMKATTARAKPENLARTTTTADETAPESNEDSEVQPPVKRQRVSKTTTGTKGAKASLRPVTTTAPTRTPKSKGPAKTGNSQVVTDSLEDQGINSYLLDAVDQIVQEEDLADVKVHKTRGKA